MPGEGIGGVAVAENLVIVGCRDTFDLHDVFLAFDASTGAVRWRVDYPAPGRLDYGNSPRATPLITPTATYLLGAFGNLHAVDTSSGRILWKKDLRVEFATPELPWGLTGSPLIAGDKLIVQPGGLIAGLVALDPTTGTVIWQSAGGKPGHASLVTFPIADSTQLVGYDAVSLGGWDLESGKRLWTIKPELSGDFNVPTPMCIDAHHLCVATENNGTRLYAFSDDGMPNSIPQATNLDLTPDSHSPVHSIDRIYGLANGLRCLDAKTLKEYWVDETDPFHRYGSLIVCGNRLLLLNQDCLLMLLEDAGDECRQLGSLALVDDGQETLAHPALVGSRLYVRLGKTLACLDLLGSETTAKP